MGCVHAKANEVAISGVMPHQPAPLLTMPGETRDDSQAASPKTSKRQPEPFNHVVCPPGSMRVSVPSHNYALRYSYLSQRGYYPDALDKANQDSFSVNPCFGSNPSDHFFGVFDGHGEFGTPCSQFACSKMPENMLACRQYASDPVAAYHTSFSLTNAQLHRHHIDDSMSGTTGVTVLVRGRTLYCANVGDSRAVLAEWQGRKLVAVDLSNDQTPFRADEAARVKMCGARVLTLDQLEGLKDPNVQCWGGEEDDDGDPPRLWVQNGMYPGTAFTRSVGDTIAEKIGVVAIPEVIVTEVTKNNPFFVIASDGVFEFLSSQSVVDMVSKFEDPHDACAAIVAESYRLWLQYETRTDDITIIVVHLEGLGDEEPEPLLLAAEASTPSSTASIAKVEGLPPVKVAVTSPGTPSRPVRRDMSKSMRELVHREGLLSDDEDAEQPWSPVKHTLPPKTPEERARIDAAVKANFLFNKLSGKQRNALFDCMERIHVQAGGVVIRQGAMGDRFYIVESGEFEVLKAEKGAAPEELGVVVHRYHSRTNPSFGDLALMYNKPREATVRAITAGSLWALDRGAFRAILTKSSRRSLIRTLRNAAGLQSLSLPQLQRLADALTEVVFEEGATVYAIEDEEDMLYIIEKGEVEAVFRFATAPPSLTESASRNDMSSTSDLASPGEQAREAAPSAIVSDVPRQASQLGVIAAEGGLTSGRTTGELENGSALLPPIQPAVVDGSRIGQSHAEVLGPSQLLGAWGLGGTAENEGSASQEQCLLFATAKSGRVKCLALRKDALLGVLGAPKFRGDP